MFLSIFFDVAGESTVFLDSVKYTYNTKTPNLMVSESVDISGTEQTTTYKFEKPLSVKEYKSLGLKLVYDYNRN